MANIQISSNAQEVGKELREKLASMQANLKLTVFRALTILEAEILQNIRLKSGLKVRTGALLNSVGASKKITTGESGEVIGQIGSEGVPYAKIHEFGGTTKPHVIMARNAKALAFINGSGDQVFARFVNHPGSVIPARPYLRPALAAKQDEILKTFGLMLKAAFEKE